MGTLRTMLLGVVTVASTMLVGCGGCYSHQQGFDVTPPEPCLQPVFDACQAQESTLTIDNGCSSALTLGGTTIGAGKQGSLDVDAFSHGSNVSIPATLGSMSIVISYSVASGS